MKVMRIRLARKIVKGYREDGRYRVGLYIVAAKRIYKVRPWPTNVVIFENMVQLNPFGNPFVDVVPS